MSPVDHTSAADAFDDELPELPIPRPTEWTAAPIDAPTPIATPSLGGGGASYTSVEPDAMPVITSSAAAMAPAPQAAAPRPTTNADDLASAEHVAAERLAWEMAATLTSGMLANPGRSHASVKDAMGLFDQFLQEMHTYSRIAAGFDLLRSDADRRRAHEEYFHGSRAESPEQLPVMQATITPVTAAQPSRPEPMKPRPLGTYQAIPPGARGGPYAPGGMTSPPPHSSEPDAGSSAA